MSTPRRPAATAMLNARYIAIRTAEAKGLTGRLLEAARDRTPGVRRLLAPSLYRFWAREREQGWRLLEQIAAGAIRFPGLVDREALEIFGEVSMPILNACRQDPGQLARLAAIWQAQMAALFDSPLARAGRLFARGWVLKAGAAALAEVMKRQPAYQLVNFQELEVTFARPDAFRRLWREALDGLEDPQGDPGAIERILSDATLPYDLYLMLACERALIVQCARRDPEETLGLAERLFHRGCPWFRQSILYVLFHVLGNQAEVTDDILDRYDALALEFFASGSWRLQTSVKLYGLANIVANSDVLAARHRPGRVPRVVPELLERAIAASDKGEIAAIFAAIDGVAFYHNDGPLALEMIKVASDIGGKAVQENVLRSLATVRLTNQLLVDTLIAQHRAFADISPDYVAAVESSVGEEDFLTLIDGFIIHLLLSSPYFHRQLCAAFGRALTVRTVEEYMIQLVTWVRDELRALPPAI